MEQTKQETKQLAVKFPVDFYQEFEKKCKESGLSMSGVIKLLVSDWMGR